MTSHVPVLSILIQDHRPDKESGGKVTSTSVASGTMEIGGRPQGNLRIRTPTDFDTWRNVQAVAVSLMG